MAEKLYVEAGCTREVVDMYNTAGKWEQAHKVGTFCIGYIFGVKSFLVFM